jgi:hypothetical protein
MLVPDYMKDCSCFIGYRTTSDQQTKWGATAFFVGVKLVENREERARYVVTAKHCIDALRGMPNDNKTYLRINRKSGDVVEIDFACDSWTYHPTDEDHVDVAVHPLGDVSEFQSRYLHAEAFASKERIIERKIGLGDEVVIIGLFREHAGTERNVPIIRTGNIAAMPEEPVSTRQWGPIAAHLIECRSISGLSGSPVLAHLDGWAGQKGGRVMVSSDKRSHGSFHLLGLMHGHWDSTDTAIVEDMGGNPRVNMGIAVVVTADKILEVLNHPELIRQREETAQNLPPKASEAKPI